MGNTSAKSIDLENLDSYEVFGISKDFTWDQLKNAYKQAALKTHPDKPGGNKVLFDFVTERFEKLALEYKSRESNKTHNDLKQDSLNFHKQNRAFEQSFDTDTSEPFINKFNKAFDKFKFHDESIEGGYGEIMMKSNGVREDIKIENIFDKQDIKNKNFNEVFNQKNPVENKVTKYVEPAPLLMAKKIQFTEIGSKKTDDYTGESESKNLIYTDYLKAYSGERLVDPNSKFKEFNSIKDYQKYREKKTKTKLSNKENKRVEKKKILDEKQEFERLERIKQNDIAIQKAHELANRFLIK